MEVGYPWARGLQPQSHPKAEEHPQAYQPATPTRAPAPHYGTHHTEARSLVEVKWTNPWNKEKKPGRRETLNQESGGREGNQEKRYATLLQCHAMLTNLRVQCKHNVGTWPAHALKRHTAGQESAPKLTNNGKRYKRKHSHATALQMAKTPPKNAKTLETTAPSR